MIPGLGIVSETDKATSHLAEVAGQLGEEPTAKKKQAKRKVHTEDGITEGDKAKKLDMAASQYDPGDLVGGGATGTGSEDDLEGAKLVGCEGNVKGTEGFWTPEENDSDDAGTSPTTAVAGMAPTNEQ